VSLRCPETGDTVDRVPAQIDHGADRTVIPERYALQLGLKSLDLLPVAGLGGQVHQTSTYELDLMVHTFPPERVEVFAHRDEPYVLLGRDILNRYRLVLDGPGLALEIG
jgi:hypothetical protein